MSSTDNVGVGNIEETPVNELRGFELRREKARIEKELSRIRVEEKRSRTNQYTTTDTATFPVEADTEKPFGDLESVTRRKRELERRLQQIESKLRLEPPITNATATGNIEDTIVPDYGTEYTLLPDGQVERFLPVNLDPAYKQGLTDQRARQAGYLLGSPTQGVTADVRFITQSGEEQVGAFKDAKDIGNITGILKGDQEFRDSIYANYLNRPEDVTELKKKLVKIVPSIMSGEPIDGEVTPTFLEAMAAVANDISQRNYYRQQEKQNLFTLDQGIEYLLQRGSLQGPQVRTEKSFYSISDGEAKAVLDAFYEDALGRRATKEEADKFASVVRKRAGRKPQVGQTTTSADGLSSETRITEPGFGQAEAELTARRQAEAGPEFESYRLATSYYTALLRAIGSPVPINQPGE